MRTSPDQSRQDRTTLFAYIIGLMTAVVILGLCLVFVGYKIGFSNVKRAIMPEPTASKSLVRLPKDILEELARRQAVFSNAGNPTKQPRHNTILVHPDQELEYVVRPNVRIFANMLNSAKPLNLDPPVLYLKEEEVEYSEQLKRYLSEESRLRYSYSTDSEGFRRTVPSVTSDKRILIVGDSIPFGVGVDDEHTVASYLQRLVGREYRIINGGVGGYTGQQAFLAAKRISKDRKFAGLIYIASQNDFMQADDWIKEATNVLTKFHSIADRFDNNITVMLATYMEYTLRDILLKQGWRDDIIEGTHALRRTLPDLTRQLGFRYYDWTDLVDDFMKTERSIFARFALYVDHAHLSPLGNRLMAERLVPAIRRSDR